MKVTPEIVTESSLTPPDTCCFTHIAPTHTAASYITFDSLSTSLGGSQPFSYALYLRFNSFGVPPGNPSAAWTYDQQILSFGTDSSGNGGGISAGYADDGFYLLVSYLTGTFQFEVVADTWYYVVFTWDGTTATAYVNGSVESFTLPKTSISSPVFAIGWDVTEPPPQPNEGVTQSSFIGDLQSFLVWDVCLSPDDVQQQMWSPADSPVAGSSIILGYDFTTNPPNMVGSGPGISPVNISYATKSMALCSWGTDVATPGLGTTINPGGAAPFSILAWVCISLPDGEGNLDGYIFANGDQSDANHLGLKLQDGQLIAEISGQTVTSSQTLKSHEWYYLAVTYDGTDCTLYINNASVGSGTISGGASPANGAPQLFGIYNDSQPSDLLGGYIQMLSVWDNCLTAQAVENLANVDPTMDTHCVANFMLAQEPFVDACAVAEYSAWGAEDSLMLGSNMYLGLTRQLPASESGAAAPGRAGDYRTEGQREPVLRLERAPGALKPATAEPFSEAHKRMMVKEFKSALSGLGKSSTAAAWLESYEQEVDRVFDLAAASPDLLDGPNVTYEIVDGQYALFYHPDLESKIDLGVRVDISQECAVWWAAFILTLFVGAMGLWGITFPEGQVAKLQALATEIVTNPVIIDTLKTFTGGALTAHVVIDLCAVLYAYGYLSQAFWLVVSVIGWWTVGKLLVYVGGILAPTASPQKVLFIASCLVLVAQLAYKLTSYPQACLSGECDSGDCLAPVMA